MRYNIRNSNVFFKDQEKDLDCLFTDVLTCIGSEINLDMSFSKHNFQLFKCVIIMNYANDKIIDNIINSVVYLFSKKNISSTVFKDCVCESLIKQEKALTFYWQTKAFLSTPEKIKEMPLCNRIHFYFSLINDYIEYLINNEIYIIYSLHLLNENRKEKIEDIDLSKKIMILKNVPCFLLNDINTLDIYGISINQWRNIAAHGSYECLNDKIEVIYSNECKKIISFNELEKVLTVISNLRFYVKLIGNLTIEASMQLYPDIHDYVTYVPETVIAEINFQLNKFNTNITSFSVEDSFKKNKITLAEKGMKYADLKVMSLHDKTEEVLLELVLATPEIEKIFSKKNGYLNNENIIIIFDVVFRKNNFNMLVSISKDEIDKIEKYPLQYSKILLSKIESAKFD
jgi:hypothetical protein